VGKVRDLPNVLMLHFARLKRDLPGETRRIACFLEVPIDEARFPAIVEHCSFDYMKKNVTKSTPLGGVFWDGGAETFIHKGTNGRWRDVLNAENVTRIKRSLTLLYLTALGFPDTFVLGTGRRVRA
jgi:aryl sulfotransferase